MNETEQLFKVMKKLKDEGVGIIFITHFISQVFEISDRITVLRNGKLVGTYETASISRVDLISKMIGRSLAEFDEMSKIKLESAKHIKSEALLTGQGAGADRRYQSLRSGSACRRSGRPGRLAWFRAHRNRQRALRG